MKRLTPLLYATLAVILSAPAIAQDIENTSYSAPDGAPVLQHTVIVNATLQDAWEAFTTTEGLTDWGAPYAKLDLRMGGLWESNYSKDIVSGNPGNIRFRYVSFVPMQVVTMQAENAPPGFPHRGFFPRLVTVVEFEEVSPNETRVTLSMLGYDSSPELQEIYSFFEAGNDYSLKQLYRRFEEGPVDWNAAQSPGGNTQDSAH